MDDNKIREHLNRALDLEQITVSEDLISKTLKTIQGKEMVPKEQKPNPRAKLWKISGRLGLAAAGIAVLVIGIRILPLSSDKRSKQNAYTAGEAAPMEGAESEENLTSQDVIAEESQELMEAPAAEPYFPVRIGRAGENGVAMVEEPDFMEELQLLSLPYLAAAEDIMEKENADELGQADDSGQWSYWVEIPVDGMVKRVYFAEDAEEAERLGEIYNKFVEE